MHTINEKYITNYKKIIRLGTPIVIGQLGNIILGFIDTIMVGHYSAEAVAEVERFLANNPDYPTLLKNKILQATHR